MTPFFKRKGVLAVYSMINKAHRHLGIHLKVGELYIGAPRVVNASEHNTKLMTWSSRPLSYVGNVFFDYNRVDVKQYFGRMWGSESELILDSAGSVKISDLLGRIESRYGIYLDPEDIVDVALDTDAGYSTVDLVLSPDSYIYTGSITLHLFNSSVSNVRKVSNGQLRRTDIGLRMVSGSNDEYS